MLKKVLATLLLTLTFAFTATPAFAQVAPVNPDPSSNPISTPTTVATNNSTQNPNGPQGPQGPQGPGAEGAASASINLDLNAALNKPSQSILIIILITLLSVAPALLIMMTSFTRVIIVLSLTRNALGAPAIPPNQVLTGLALFITLFIMTPTFQAMNKEGVQPYMRGEMSQSQAFEAASKPLKDFMLKNTRQDELALFSRAASDVKPESADKLSLTTIAPAFLLSELKTAFIIGFVIFIPFLVIDIIVSSALMSMGMMMLPPQMISLPFKLLLFVMVDGWALVAKSLLTSFN